MSRSSHCAIFVPFLFAALAAAQPKFDGGVHEDPALGFKIKVPDKWTMVPVDIDEKWIVAKYLGNREYFGKIDYRRWKPEMQVVHFNPEKAKVKEKVETHGDTTYGSASAGFRNYKDWFTAYIKTTGLGFHYEVEGKADTLGGVPVTYYNVVGTSGTDKVLRFVAWVYERKADNSTIAVQFSQLEDYFENLAPDFDRSFKSFKFIAQTAVAASASVADADLESPMWTRDRSKWRGLPKAERWKIRQDMENKRRAKVLANVPEGWKLQEGKTKRYTALSHADPKYTTLVLDVADATWDWLDKRFADVSDEYVMAGVIRVCKDADESRSYRSKSANSDSYSPENREIIDFKDKNSGSAGGGQTNLMTGLLRMYLWDKDSYASFYQPGWLITATATYMATGQLEGKKLVFKKDNDSYTFIKQAERNGALRSFNEMISTPSDEWPSEREAYWGYVAQLYALGRFLESPEAAKLKVLDKLALRYTKAVAKAGEEWEKKNPGTSQAKTEAEEESQAKDRNKRWKEMEKFILEAANKEVANFSTKEWQAIEAAWKKYLTS